MTEPKPTDPSIQSGSYALNALDADEKAAFEAHLAESEETRNEVTELSDTAVLMGLAVSPVAPPASLKASIMSQLDSTPQLPATDAPAQPTPRAGLEAPERAPGAAERRATARWTAKPVTALAAAAAVIGLVAGGGIVTTAIVQNIERQEQANTLASIYAAPDVQRRTVEMEGGNATLVWSGELAASALIMDGLQPLPAHQVYELWYIGADGARSAGTFTADAAHTWRVLEGQMHSGDVVGVTIEPRGGSPEPTTDPIVVIESA